MYIQRKLPDIAGLDVLLHGKTAREVGSGLGSAHPLQKSILSLSLFQRSFDGFRDVTLRLLLCDRTTFSERYPRDA